VGVRPDRPAAEPQGRPVAAPQVAARSALRVAAKRREEPAPARVPQVVVPLELRPAVTPVEQFAQQRESTRR